jgi:heat shock protein 4
MYLTKIKQIAQAELKLPVQDIVLSVPAWYTDAQRRAIMDAADIAGLKCLRLINDTTAVALGYGITKTDLPGPEEKPKRVAFVDIGHSNYTCSIVEFKKGELAVKSTACDRHFGGRNFDSALVDHWAKEFKEKFKIDINQNLKARFRVLAACEKMKKVLSANANAPINIESLMNDTDVRGMMKREELEELMKPLLERATAPIEQALIDAKLKIEDIDTIEMVGGCTRVPALKSAIQNYFGRPLSFTLNQDEASARGCAFSCAILSPVFRVRDFSIHDIVAYPIEFTWEKSPDIPDEDTSLTVFNRGNTLPSTKILTFYRKQPFDLEARYAKPEQLPGKVNPWIGRFSVKGVKADSKDDFMICKLKARVNIHGILSVDSGYYVEEVEVEEPIPEPKEGEVCEKPESAVGGAAADAIGSKQGELPIPPLRAKKRDYGQVFASASSSSMKKRSSDQPFAAAPGRLALDYSLTSPETQLTGVQAMDTDAANGEAEPPKVKKTKKQVKKGELPLSAGTASLDQASKDEAAEKENTMAMEDKLVADTEDKKNELESFIYELREKIDGQYSEFANEDEKAKVHEKCTQTEVSSHSTLFLSLHI